MSTEFIVLIGSILVQIIGVFTQHSITKYRIEQLEKKVDKHNNVVERTYELEGLMREARADINEIKGRIR